MSKQKLTRLHRKVLTQIDENGGAVKRLGLYEVGIDSPANGPLTYRWHPDAYPKPVYLKTVKALAHRGLLNEDTPNHFVLTDTARQVLAKGHTR
jgi:hypothetical protein